MATNNKNKTVLDFFDSTALELLRTDLDYAKKFLQEEGFNLDEELSFSAKHITKLKFAVQAVTNKKKDQQLLQVAYARLKDAIQENAQKATETLKELLQSRAPSVQYRKIENWTDDEIREVLADIDLVKLLEELSKED